MVSRGYGSDATAADRLWWDLARANNHPRPIGDTSTRCEQPSETHQGFVNSLGQGRPLWREGENNMVRKGDESGTRRLGVAALTDRFRQTKPWANWGRVTSGTAHENPRHRGRRSVPM